MVVHIAVNDDVGGSSPSIPAIIQSSVIGNTSGFEPEEFRFDP